MATLKQMRELALHAVKGTAPETFTVDNVNEAFADGLKEMAGSINQFMKNKYDIYDIIIEAVDEVVPNKVIDAVGIFAEVQQVAQGQKAMFKRKLGRERAKQFLTQVGLSGVYETFRLDSETFEVSASAVGGAVTIDFERMLDNAEDLADLVQILTEGLVDSVYVEVQKALRAAINATGRPSANKVSSSSFDADEMVKLVNVVKAYGSSAVILLRLNLLQIWGQMLLLQLEQVIRVYTIHRISMLFIIKDISTFLEVHLSYRFLNLILMKIMKRLGLTLS